MYCGSFEIAMKQAKANANLTQTPWIVFAYGNKWYCEKRDSQQDGRVVYPESRPEAARKDGE